MNKWIRMALGLVWSLWFGGMMALFMFVQALFKTRPDISPDAASTLFISFQRYQLILAALALLLTFGLRWMTRSRASALLFGAFAGATVLTVLLAGWLTPRMEALRLAGESKGPEFAQLHGLSMGLFMLDALALLAAGIALACARNPRPALSDDAPAA